MIDNLLQVLWEMNWFLQDNHKLRVAILETNLMFLLNSTKLIK